jgi:hypothetical protein
MSSPELNSGFQKEAQIKAVEAFIDFCLASKPSMNNNSKSIEPFSNVGYVEAYYKDSQGRVVEVRLTVSNEPYSFILFANRGETAAMEELKVKLIEKGVNIIGSGEQPSLR